MASRRRTEDRPVGVRRRTLSPGTPLWRIDSTEPSDWTWDGFAAPRHRFDPTSGTFRTRYASRSLHGAFRERYLATGLLIPADHADHLLVRLTTTRPLRTFDLRTEANLQAIGADDRISTSHEPEIWQACHDLADDIRTWWPDLDGILYRSRTTPASSANLAFWSADGLDSSARPLRECTTELIDLILHHHLTVDVDLD